MNEHRPPFRADHVGSLLRPLNLREALARARSGDISLEQLREIQDREITSIIRRQEEIGLRAVTDGEFRRSWWHFDFFDGLDGVRIIETTQGIVFQGVETRAQGIEVTGKIGFPEDHPMLDHFRYLATRSKSVPKMTIPSPSVLHFRLADGAFREVYPDTDELFDDLAHAWSRAVLAFHDAGCRYLQFDDTAWGALCSPEEREKARARGHDVDRLSEQYAGTINAAVSHRPDDMAITMHVCRGNFRSTWISEGDYEPVAEQVLGGLNIDGYFLEYDSERAGGFEPLRFLPRGDKMVVLGLITSKTGSLEHADDIRRRIDQAADYVDRSQLCLSPQCGFASTEEGNVLTESEQWSKLQRVVEVAEAVWG